MAGPFAPSHPPYWPPGAHAYVSALGALFEGDSVSAQAEVVKQQLANISATCKAAFEGA
jgi:hypothetical protein